MEWELLLTKVELWGSPAAMILLIVSVLSLHRRFKKHEDEDTKKEEQLKNFISTKLKEENAEITKKYTELKERISYLEMEGVRNDTFYREMSGWKTEINRLNDNVTKMFSESMNKIIEVWKEQK